MSDIRDLLVGCSFTDPTWQKVIPWSVLYGNDRPSYIVAKAGMGIKGICSEAISFIDSITCKIDRVIIILPTLWRLDIEVDVETYLCNAMVDLIECDHLGWRRATQASRKWLTSGGLNYDKTTEMATAFDFLYRHQGFLVIAKEHFRALERLIDRCKEYKIKYYISAIQDPLDQLLGLDYISQDIKAFLYKVDYDKWFKFDGQFIDRFLKHPNHPNNQEHKMLYNHIQQFLSTEEPNG